MVSRAWPGLAPSLPDPGSVPAAARGAAAALTPILMADNLTLDQGNVFVVVQPAADGKTLTFPSPSACPGQEILVLAENGNYIDDSSLGYGITLSLDQATPTSGGVGLPIHYVSNGVHWYAPDF